MRGRLLCSIFTAAAVAWFAASAAGAQAPRPIPRTPEGKPDFSGLWDAGAVGPTANSTARPSGPAATTIRRLPTRAELAKELPLTAWGREQVAIAISNDGEFGGETGTPEDPRFHSLCGGPKSPSDLGAPIEISQNPRRLFLVHLGNSTRMWLRQFWIGREHPKDITDYDPVWMGHSVAKWDGDTLVVDTIRIKEGALLENRTAAPHSDQLHMIERYQLTDGETLRVDRTFDDPKAYTKPWSNRSVYKSMKDWDYYSGEWEIAEQHDICVGGRYSEENDPWFEHYDEIKILPNKK